MATHSSKHKSFEFALTLLRKYFVDVFYVLLGSFVTTPILVLYIVITLPFFLYRLTIAFILSKFYRSDHGYQKLLSPGFSTAYALEYVSSVWKGEPSRNTGLSRTIIEGHIPFDLWKDRVETGWINARNDKKFRKFQVFREYVHSWMGYCYWRKDFNFDLNTHLHYQKIKESEDLDQYTSDMFEKLMNAPFKQHRSPWDIYIIHGWGNTSACQESNLNAKTEVTVLVTRNHHLLGDGRSFASLLIKDLFGNRMEDCHKQHSTNLSKSKNLQNFTNLAFSCVSTVVKLMWDFGKIIFIVLCKVNANTKLHKFDNPGYVHQMSPLISMDSVKNVRKELGVNFSSVIVSGLAAAIGDCLDVKNKSKFLLVAPRPLPGHPGDKMVNHLTGAVYNIPLDVNMHSMQRLHECDKVLKMVNQSLFPIYIFPILLHLLSFHVAPVAKFGFKSRLFGVSFSNNVGSDMPINVFGKYRLMESNAAVGTFDGSTGVVVTMTSYVNHFRLHAIANSSALSKKDLELFMERVISEIKALTKIASSSRQLL